MSGYCKYCDSLKNAIVTVFDNGVAVWVGCVDCYLRRKEVITNNE